MVKQTRVAVIGPCASGKTSVAAGLRQQGLNSWSVGQEHSDVTDLWNSKHPDFLVYLHICLTTLRLRRNNASWPEWIYLLQLERLSHGRSNANVIINTNVLDLEQVVRVAHMEILRLQTQSG